MRTIACLRSGIIVEVAEIFDTVEAYALRKGHKMQWRQLDAYVVYDYLKRRPGIGYIRAGMNRPEDGKRVIEGVETEAYLAQRTINGLRHYVLYVIPV